MTTHELETKIMICEGLIRLCEVTLRKSEASPVTFVVKREDEEKLRRLRAELERREADGWN